MTSKCLKFVYSIAIKNLVILVMKLLYTIIKFATACCLFLYCTYSYISVIVIINMFM